MKTYLALLGVVLLACGLFATCRRAHIAWRGLDAVGTVVGPSTNVVEGYEYVATRVAYVRAGDVEVEFTYYSGRPGALPAGTRVPVRYLAGKEGAHVVRSLPGYALAPVVLFALGLVCLYAAYR